MNRSDLINRVTRSGLTAMQAEKAVDVILETISQTLASGTTVTIKNFGRFEPRRKSAVTRTNPRNGEKIEIPEKTTAVFRPAPHLKRKLNGPVSSDKAS